MLNYENEFKTISLQGEREQCHFIAFFHVQILQRIPPNRNHTIRNMTLIYLFFLSMTIV